MAGPFGIEQVDVPGILGIYQGAKDRRLNEMLLQRKIALEDRQLQRQQTMSDIWAKAAQIGTKGGDQNAPAGGMAAAYAPAQPAAPPASVPSALPQSINDVQNTYPIPSFGGGSAAPAATSALPPSPDQALNAADNGSEQLIARAFAADPEQGMQVQKFLQGVTAERRKQFSDSQDALITLGYAVRDLPYEQRRQVIMQRAGDLIRAHPGMTMDQVAQFDPTDQNIDITVSQSLGLKALAEKAEKERQFAETQRHNRATEANAAGGLAVRQGALGLAQKREGRVASGKGGGPSSDNSDLNYLIGGN